MKHSVILCIIMILLTSCSIAKYQPTQRDSVIVTKLDTKVHYDSVYIYKYDIIKEKGDTVYITKTNTEYKYKYLDKIKIDTIYLDKIVTETKLVEKPLTKFQTFQIKTFWVLIVLVIGLLIIKIIHKMIK